MNITVTELTACETGSANTWTDSPMGQFNDLLSAEFDVTPQAAGLDGLVGLSLGAANWWPKLAVAVRFSGTNTIDARNGDVYAATQAVSYAPGTKYHSGSWSMSRP